MASRSPDTLLAFLQETLETAGKAINACISPDLRIRQKKDHSLVTEADMASEKVIIERIQSSFAADYTYSEESGCHPAQEVTTFPLAEEEHVDTNALDWSFADRKEGDYVWVIDPLDGTTNFANNYPFYCVSVALGEVQANGRIVTLAGGVHNPVDDTTYLAYRGRGAFCNGQRLKVTAERDLQDSFLATGICAKGQRLAVGGQIGSNIDLGGADNSIRSDGAAALDLALVARGVYDAFWEQGLKPWDMAAGWLLVTEAGGEVRNYHTVADFDIEDGNIIAGNAVTVARLAERIARDLPHA